MRLVSTALRTVGFIGVALLLYGCSDATNPTGPGSDDGEEAASFDSEAAPGA